MTTNDSSTPPGEDLPDADGSITTEPGQTRAEAARAATTRGSSVAPFVFWPSLIILCAAVTWAVIDPAGMQGGLEGARDWIGESLGWYYILIVAGFVLFSAWMALSRLGDIKLGKDDDDPEFGWLAWFCMLFAAGMGIGLVFWGVAEPLWFMATPKDGTDVAGIAADGTEIMEPAAEVARNSMSQVFLHWGVHAWAIYVVVGLALAYSIHRRGNPVSIRWALEPVLGRRIHGRLGDVIDVTAVVGTVAGVATSLGLGVTQIGAGLGALGWVNADDDGAVSNGVAFVIIVLITAVAIVSVVTGVHKGIKILSNANLALAAVFLVVVGLVGPTAFIFREAVESTGLYLQNLVQMSFDTGAATGDESGFINTVWTVFYWGWWMSWAPFVGVFIARISKGRTIREFVAGVLLVPTTVTFIWFSVMGGSAIWRELFGAENTRLISWDEDGVGAVSTNNALFDLVGSLPSGDTTSDPGALGYILIGVAVVLVTIFFVTSSDSGSLVVDMIASGGNENPPVWSRVLWCVVEGAVAFALLLAGGLAAIQAGAIITALPFSVVMILLAYSTYKAVSAEHKVLVRAQREQRQAQLTREVGGDVTEELTENFDEHFGDQVDDRISTVLAENGDRKRR